MQLAMKELITNLVTSAIVSLYLLELLSSYPENDHHKIHREYSNFWNEYAIYFIE